ncbi:MAG: type I-C CRISPR-associated endonuclease Cas1 [Elusimicrobia bacterium]|nr:type I-C CRISPR-associated endonuclease Cas1 [Elusimicrobiota bacterium]
MDSVTQNTLYVMTQGAYLHRDHLTVKVEIEKETRLSVPIHHLESVCVFGNIMVSPGVMQLCMEHGAAFTFMSETGRLIARVDAPQSGNVLLRREQFRKADKPDESLKIARWIIAGKLQNSRGILMRTARQIDNADDVAALDKAAHDIAYFIKKLESAEFVDEARGYEGESAKIYFGVFNNLMKQQRENFKITDRNRRPPLDPANALLSFSYALLLHDCVAALTAAGLDPNVGFLHSDRPGRPSLALDLMEEFRPMIADRHVLTLINRREVDKGCFTKRDGGAVEMSDAARKAVVSGYQQRKQEEVEHPLLEQKMTVGMLPFAQARLLARYIRGDIQEYPPCVLR